MLDHKLVDIVWRWSFIKDESATNRATLSSFRMIISVYQGLSKHQEVSSTPLTKVTKLIVVSWDFFGAIKN